MAQRRFGDRRDGTLLRELDSLHFIMGVIYPNRCDNEAYISQQVDLTPIKAYLEEKNREASDFPYTFFHVLVTAVLKTVTLRPKLNRFIANENYYQRNEVTAAFVVKKQFTDKSEEALAFLRAGDEDTVDTVHESIRAQVQDLRSDRNNSTGDSMDMFNRLPRFLSKFLLHVTMWLDRHGWVPRAFVENDPNYSSVFLSNLGSIKLKCGYHHLSNWGTSSLFCIVGEKRWTPVYDASGLVGTRETVDLGLTVDERIADGYYYSKSIRLLKYLLEHPALLERPMKEEVSYER